MQIYLINLARRPDRLAFMEAQLAKLGLPFIRIDAVDGLGEDDIGYPENHPALTKPEYACYLSHIKAYKAFVESGESHGLILEDDAQLSAHLPEFLAHSGFFTRKNAVVRVEAPTLEYWKKPARIERQPVDSQHNFELYRIKSNTMGTGAFVISQEIAKRVISNHLEPTIQIDVLLMGKGHITNPPIEILQVNPSLAKQRQYFEHSTYTPEQDSDIITSRKIRLKNMRHGKSDTGIFAQLAANFIHNSKRVINTFALLLFPHKYFHYDPSEPAVTPDDRQQ